MDISGKTALITGGARVGRAVSDALARRGCSIAVTYRASRDAAEGAVAAARAGGVPAEAYRADVRDEAAVRDTVDRVARDFGRIDVLVNMASVYARTPLSTLGSAAWAGAIDTDARSAFLFSVAAAPHMRIAGGGRIVNFSDWLPVSGRPRYEGYAPYYVAKAAVAGLTEALALELAPEILVNAIAPGPILPPPDMGEEDRGRVVAATPLRRWGGAEEIAKAVIFLVETDFVTGECLRVDGGRHLY